MLLTLAAQRSVEAFEAEKQGLESDNAALRKALHSLEVRRPRQRRSTLQCSYWKSNIVRDRRGDASLWVACMPALFCARSTLMLCKAQVTGQDGI